MLSLFQLRLKCKIADWKLSAQISEDNKLTITASDSECSSNKGDNDLLFVEGHDPNS